MQFCKYGSIDNSYRTQTINAIQDMGFSEQTWCVQEKIHGANFSLWYDGTEIKAGKKSGFIKENEKFYNYQRVVENNKKHVYDLWNTLMCREGDVIVVYGEIFGGSYPHPDVEKVPGISRVQKGVNYCPDVGFYAFDLALKKDNDKLELLDVDVAHEFLVSCGFLTAPLLLIGSFEDCMFYPNEFQTKIPELLGLPIIDNNICEGVVLKPLKSCYFPSGSRVILKNKNCRFKEKEATKKVKPPAEPLSEEAQNILNEYASYVTENRLRNVLSHCGGIHNNKDFGKLLGMFSKDIYEDFQKDFGDKYESLEANEKKVLKKRFSVISSSLIRNNFVDILDGEF